MSCGWQFWSLVLFTILERLWGLLPHRTDLNCFLMNLVFYILSISSLLPANFFFFFFNGKYWLGDEERPRKKVMVGQLRSLPWTSAGKWAHSTHLCDTPVLGPSETTSACPCISLVVHPTTVVWKPRLLFLTDNFNVHHSSFPSQYIKRQACFCIVLRFTLNL